MTRRGQNGYTNMTGEFLILNIMDSLHSHFPFENSMFLDDGRSLTLKISYNGGHQSEGERLNQSTRDNLCWKFLFVKENPEFYALSTLANNFRMAFKCVPLGQEIPQVPVIFSLLL